MPVAGSSTGTKAPSALGLAGVRTVIVTSPGVTGWPLSVSFSVTTLVVPPWPPSTRNRPSSLAVMLVGEAPYARVYVPEPIRTQVKVGDSARVYIEGSDTAYPGKVRMIRSEASFTPYYALIGKDAARLSYLAEIALGKDAAQLPAGVPVRVEFDGR